MDGYKNWYQVSSLWRVKRLKKVHYNRKKYSLDDLRDRRIRNEKNVVNNLLGLEYMKMKNEIKNCFEWYKNKIEEIVQYENWSDEDYEKEIRKSTEMLLEELRRHIDWNNLTEEILRELGFEIWATDEEIDKEIAYLREPDARYLLDKSETLEDKIAGLENAKGIWLIPLYLLSIVPIGTKLIDIFGNTVIYDGHNVNKDTLFGYVSYGIKLG